MYINTFSVSVTSKTLGHYTNKNNNVSLIGPSKLLLLYMSSVQCEFVKLLSMSNVTWWLYTVLEVFVCVHICAPSTSTFFML